MPSLIESPTSIQAAGTTPKVIEEFVGRANTGTESISIARMVSPAGWEEPGQRPTFEEWSIVLRGVLVADHEGGRIKATSGQAIRTLPGEWVRYSTPLEGGAEYVAVCIPAFSPDTVHRDDVV